jgi:hypothetical protein
VSVVDYGACGVFVKRTRAARRDHPKKLATRERKTLVHES